MSRFGDGDDRLYFNGVTSDGRYVQEPLSEAELVQRMLALPPDWTLPVEKDPRGTDDPTRAPRFGVDPMRLDEAGWAVVWAPGIDPRIKRALSDLVDLRAEQAGRFFREIPYRSGEDPRGFLQRLGAPPGQAEPEKLPYYVLLVGDPRQIPYSFQWGLDQVYAVGRVCFKTTQQYANYARSVLDVEEGRVRRRPQISFFAPENEGDPATPRTRGELIEPLMRYISQPPEERAKEWHGRSWQVQGFVGSEASKSRLASLLGGDDASALLVAGGHGLEAVGDEAARRALQGALITSDWPGAGDVEVGHRFAGSDLAADARCAGLVALLVACFGAGTPEEDSVGPEGSKGHGAEAPFVADLVQRLLSSPAGGAQAVIGHVDFAWTTSFSEGKEIGQQDTYLSVLDALLAGMPVGGACEWFGQRAGDLATDLAGMWGQKHRLDEPAESRKLARLRLAYNDIRNFVVIGDPAVRLAVPGLR